MKGSLSLGKIAGIRLQIHWTFLFIIAWVIFVETRKGSDTSTIALTILFVLTIFVCVVLHELGHSLMARRYGIQTRKITLLPIGGVASLEKMPDEPKQELLVALAGPAVNVVIALLLWPFVRPVDRFLDPDNLEALQSVSPSNFLFYLFFTNIILVVFNAIPAFPMDGGRVLRALLAMRLDRVRATQIAANLGQIIAIGFFILGFLSNPFLIFIGLFVFFGASGEFTMVQQLSALKGHRVHDAMMTNFTLVQPDDDLKKIGDLLLAGTERNFIVAAPDGGVAGILYHHRVMNAFKEKRLDERVADLMDVDFQQAHPNEELTEVYRKVQGRNHSFFPVVEGDKIIGAIDMENINEFMMIQARLDY
jgi:Zn-dependent protease/predicted transcriptional regulator